MNQGKIIRIMSNLYTVQVDSEKIPCQARGLFRKQKITPLVGDFCEIDLKQRYIMKILPRKNFLLRPMIANVDCALLVTSVKEPNLSLNLLDKQIAVIKANSIQPILCFTKLDLLTEEELKAFEKIRQNYEKVGFPTFLNTELESLKESLKEKTVVVTGQTGAGKSSLLNKLDESLVLATSPISKSLGRGVHTTRHVELFSIDSFFVADTPGFSSLEINDFTTEDLLKGFPEFQNYPCKFRNCQHNKEIECGVKEALKSGEIAKSRYDNYIKFLSEVKK